MRQNYRTEFPHFDFEIPTIPEGFVDSSWHNNVCPSFERKLNDTHSITLWVNYLDENRRECGGFQFVVTVHPTEEMGIDMDYEYETNNWEYALSAINDILANEVQQ
jgi:hypothetical protein